MFGKLALRNVRRSARDYLVYVLTMTFVVSLMFAFNSIIFSKDLQKMYEMAAIMAAMIGIATFFIVLIVAWLINYMVRFMLEKRSREFGTYLLLGMNKKQISGLYMKENILMGMIAFVIGNRRRHVFAADPDDDILQSVWDGLSAPCAVKRLEYAYDQRDLHTVLFFCADPKPTAVQKDDHCGIDADGKGK